MNRIKFLTLFLVSLPLTTSAYANPSGHTVTSHMGGGYSAGGSGSLGSSSGSFPIGGYSATQAQSDRNRAAMAATAIAIQNSQAQLDQTRAETARIQQQITHSLSSAGGLPSLVSVDEVIAKALAERESTQKNHPKRSAQSRAEYSSVSHAKIHYNFKSQGAFRSQLVSTYQQLLDVQPFEENRQTARTLGLYSIEEADQLQSEQELEQSQFLLELGKGFLDLAVGLDPFTGFARGTYELITGCNFITGEKLSTFERSLSAVSVLSLGGSSSFASLGKLLGKVAHYADSADHLKHALQQGRKIVNSAGRLGIAERDLGRVINDANHIFGPKKLAEHKLGGFLEKFSGDQLHAFKSLEEATQALASRGQINGIFTTTVLVKDTTITVSGRVIDGIARIGTAFIP